MSSLVLGTLVIELLLKPLHRLLEPKIAPIHYVVQRLSIPKEYTIRTGNRGADRAQMAT
jgi:hypothetical protein